MDGLVCHEVVIRKKYSKTRFVFLFPEIHEQQDVGSEDDDVGWDVVPSGFPDVSLDGTRDLWGF